MHLQGTTIDQFNDSHYYKFCSVVAIWAIPLVDQNLCVNAHFSLGILSSDQPLKIMRLAFVTCNTCKALDGVLQKL